MLREIRVSQAPKDGIKRRWFQSDFFDLYVWQDDAAISDDATTITGIQICYSITRNERALTWKRGVGFFHDGVDSGDDQLPGAATPILVADGLYEGDPVTQRFAREAADLSPALKRFIMTKIAEFSKEHEVLHQAKTKRKQVRREDWQKRLTEEGLGKIEGFAARELIKMDTKAQVAELLEVALKAALKPTLQTAAPDSSSLESLPLITLERPKVAEHGDLACNIAMQVAKRLKRNPRDLAQALIAALPVNDLITSAEIAGPGFINLRLSAASKQAVVQRVLRAPASYGSSARGAGQKVMVEFVSANPTGPLHVGHGRQGALGDAICALFERQGYAVTREFYYNDAGVQIGNLALSVQARTQGLNPDLPGWPKDAYNGEYIADIARDFLAKQTVRAADKETTASGDLNDITSIRDFAVAYLRREQDLDLRAFGVRFDNYYLESSLYADGRVARAVADMVASGKTFEEGGALWLKSTDFGDDKDRVMKKSDGTYTYFVPDVAYHLAKFERGFGRAINIQGSDHHGTIARVRAGLQAAGHAMRKPVPQGFPDYVLHKMVTVLKDGEEVKISKRAGSYVTLRDLITWSGDGIKGRDAVRFFLLSRKADTEFVFDVDLALKSSDENPVYYVQYGHARIASVLRNWAERDAGKVERLSTVDLSPLTHAREFALMQRLSEYPEMLQRAAEELSPHDVVFYLRDLVGQFHSFYGECKVLVDDTAQKEARLALIQAVRCVIQNGLSVLGISASDSM